MIEIKVEHNFNGDDVEIFKMTEAAVRWCMTNQHRFYLRKPEKKELDEEDIPF